MPETLSQRLIESLEPVRDQLYVLAQERSASAPAAEGLLQQTLRHVLSVMIDGTLKTDAARAVEDELRNGPVVAVSSDSVMPADVWARLSAGVQIEAARHGGGRGGVGINPESVLLNPDPLLAPRKGVQQEDPQAAPHLTPTRFVLVAGLAVVLGVAVTIYLATRNSKPPRHAPSMTTTATAPG